MKLAEPCEKFVIPYYILLFLCTTDMKGMCGRRSGDMFAKFLNPRGLLGGGFVPKSCTLLHLLATHSHQACL